MITIPLPHIWSSVRRDFRFCLSHCPLFLMSTTRWEATEVLVSPTFVPRRLTSRKQPFPQMEVGKIWSGSRWESGEAVATRCFDSHDQKFVRVSHAASQFIRTLAARVGFIDEGGSVPRQLRHQQLSAFNVLLWAAATGGADCHLSQWLEARAERLVYQQISERATVRTRWDVFRNTAIVGASLHESTSQSGSTIKVSGDPGWEPTSVAGHKK